ncbi:unnamed protein product [Symbiodinium natans]|uniref:Pseudouridine synthase RsuA/RluA-like domain-containing protein n=1 Tax=Symbiodinium natans TaxID=878477 RepID=A0A812K0I6_9DINO|nr:unnamed protein product [Symbiodinium natans]
MASTSTISQACAVSLLLRGSWQKGDCSDTVAALGCKKSLYLMCLSFVLPQSFIDGDAVGVKAWAGTSKLLDSCWWRAKQGLSTQIMRLSRLDAQTSGVLPVALAPCGSGVTSWYQLQFAARKVRKKYLLLCSGKPLPDGVQGTIVAPLVSGPSTEQSAMKSVWSSAGKEARTVYKVLRTFTLPLQTLMLVQAEPQTGRTHQIRAHFAGIGRPILCDRTYGGFDPSWCPRLFLHCRQVALQDVAGRPFAAEAPLSAELQEALGHLQDLAAG